MGDAQIKVIVKYGAQNINVEVPATGKVEDLMQQLQLHTQLLPRLQKLICKGKVLKGDMSLKTAQLTDGAKVMLMAAQGFQPRFPTKQSTLPSKQAHSTATLTLFLDETRVKAWKLTGIVSLRDSSLQKVPAAVWSIGLSVRVLDLGGNSLLELPLEVGSLTNLQRLQINGNGFKDGTISWQGLSSLSQLTMLTVDNNLLTVLPPEIGKLSALKSLNISNNKLTCLPEELGNLLQLEKLDLSHNCLSAVPSNLGRCIQLVEVNLSANQLTTIPTTFGQLRSLKIFLLDNNALNDFPAEVLQGCLELTTLSIHWNQLTMDDLRKVDGWMGFEQRRKDKVNKQLEFKVSSSSSSFDEGADTEKWHHW
ncbi:unnamed protein product [Sphagnum jensenii]|uniref:Ubiquitin-like domain-containing protein n=1 Tax=Sphagnum jensenii TaxID=128206 RepID=A0ABP0VKE6_9BRYO